MRILTDARTALLELLPKAGVGMEIGVWQGAFSERILRIAKPRMLHLVDPWLLDSSKSGRCAWYGEQNVTQADIESHYEAVKEKFAHLIASATVTIHRATSTEVLTRIPDEMLDYVYVDGDHRYETVLSDLHNSFRVVKGGGLICGDDYILGKWWGDGVVRALHEFLGSHAVIQDLVADRQFVLRKL